MSLTPALLPPFQQCWTFPDGRSVWVRPVQPGDAALTADFVAQGLSQASRYLRFQHALQVLTPEMAQAFTRVDPRWHVALLAWTDADGPLRQIGEARYVRNAQQPDQAEFALAVADAWQGRGLGTRLLKLLLQLARRQGLRLLFGDLLRSNQAMLALARAQGFRPRAQADPRLLRMAHLLALLPVAEAVTPGGAMAWPPPAADARTAPETRQTPAPPATANAPCA